VKAPDQYEEQHHVRHNEGADQDAREPTEIRETQPRERDRNIDAEHQGHGLEPAHFRKGFRSRGINEREQQHGRELHPGDQDLCVCLLLADCQPSRSGSAAMLLEKLSIGGLYMQSASACRHFKICQQA
jgi:hypothetical protein